MSAEQFEDFLNKQQRDPGLNELLYPFCTTDKAAEMIQKYEIDDNFKKKSKSTFYFTAFWIVVVACNRGVTIMMVMMVINELALRSAVAAGLDALPDGL